MTIVILSGVQNTLSIDFRFVQSYFFLQSIVAWVDVI
jgi:hypothetical protein